MATDNKKYVKEATVTPKGSLIFHSTRKVLHFPLCTFGHSTKTQKENKLFKK